MSDRFTQQQVEAHNRRMKTAAQHNLEAGVGQHDFVASGKEVNPKLPAKVVHIATPLATDFIVADSTDVEKLNKTEHAYYNWLRSLHMPYLGVQNITLKLADDCRFTPDFSYIDPNGKMTFVDVKGFQREDAFLKIKFAARTYRWATFIIVKKNGTTWETTEIKP